VVSKEKKVKHIETAAEAKIGADVLVVESHILNQEQLDSADAEFTYFAKVVRVTRDVHPSGSVNEDAEAMAAPWRLCDIGF
jgi:hypothetical protein